MKNKALSIAQVIVCAVSVLLIAILALTPILSVPLYAGEAMYNEVEEVLKVASYKEIEECESAEDMEAVGEKYGELTAWLYGVDDEGNEIDVELSISAITLIKGIPDTVEFIGAWLTANRIETLEKSIEQRIKNNLDYLASESYQNDLEELAELNEKLAEVDPDAVNEISIDTFRLLLTGLVTVFIDSENEAVSSNNAVLQIVAIVIVAIIKIVLVLMSLIVFPIMMIVYAISVALICLRNRNNISLMASKGMEKYNSLLGGIGIVLTTVILWPASFTSAGWIIMGAVIAVIGINIAASRFRDYSPNEFKYLNFMQICAAVAIIGVVVFAVYINKADLIGYYTGMEVELQLIDSLGIDADDEKYMTALTVIAIMAIISAFMLMFVINGIMGLLSRAACMGTPVTKRGPSKDQSLTATIFGVVIIVANKIVMGIYDLELPDEQSAAFNGALTGIIIAIAAEIALAILSRVFIPELTEAEVKAVRSGRSVTNGVKKVTVNVAAEAPVAEEAPAVEEAPVAEEAAPEATENAE